MRFKTGLTIGFAVGYVLGTKAGRERYEQIRSVWQRVAADDRVQDVTAKGKAIIDESADKARGAVSSTIAEASQKIRERTESNGERA